MTMTPSEILLRLRNQELSLQRSEMMAGHDFDPPVGIAGDRQGGSIAAISVGEEFESLSQLCHATPWQAENDLRPELLLRKRI